MSSHCVHECLHTVVDHLEEWIADCKFFTATQDIVVWKLIENMLLLSLRSTCKYSRPVFSCLNTTAVMLNFEMNLELVHKKSWTLLPGKYFDFPTVVSSSLMSDNVERAWRMWQPSDLSGVRASSLVISQSVSQSVVWSVKFNLSTREIKFLASHEAQQAVKCKQHLLQHFPCTIHKWWATFQWISAFRSRRVCIWFDS